MNTNDIKKVLISPDYDFLRTNEHLGERLRYLRSAVAMHTEQIKKVVI